jgi:RiboL-PSP-HEPN
MKSNIRSRFNSNLGRVRSLLEVYEERKQPGSGRQTVEEADLLRAAVVFLHATLEDLLRSIARWKVPYSAADVLSGIPLVSLPRGKTMFSLGELSAHRAKSVQDVIRESVGEHLERTSYNDTDDITRLLGHIGIDVTMVNGRFSDLQALMTRRHHIVHQADASNASGRGHHSARSIGRKAVHTWVESVEVFGDDLLSRL